MQDVFVQAIHDKKKIRITFFSKQDEEYLTRLCAPMDYGPSRRAEDKSDCYHSWDYESDKGRHTLSLLPEQVDKIELTAIDFDPSEFVDWDLKKSPWFVARNWGSYS